MRISDNTPSTVLAASVFILDAIFGFFFKPPVGSPFSVVLPLIARASLPIG
ncbi:hypothetical protein DFH94DRAFT_639567 [Russula ochroleuca]|uniref:Uncharacterized protein n=1 Tax=Russula ochroleuca TaxID=152965 RepID=A0A9P5MN36_9AGAM|nr:hypothetical protein DFH94DRAFT_639567 [Russula ochroleuca]